MQIYKKVLFTLPDDQPLRPVLEGRELIDIINRRNLRAGETGIPREIREVEKPQGEVSFAIIVCQPKRAMMWSEVASCATAPEGVREPLNTIPCHPTSNNGEKGLRKLGSQKEP